MADTTYDEDRRTIGEDDPDQDPPKVLLIDNGDGTYSQAVKVPDGYVLPVSDSSNGQAQNSTYIDSATTTLIKSGTGRLYRIVVTQALPGASITIHDGLTAAGAVLALVPLPSLLSSIGLQAVIPISLFMPFTTGLTIVTSASTKLTVTWS